LSKKVDEGTRELWLGMFRTMLRIRKFEHAALELYKADRLKGFMHLSVGQEAIPTGVCSTLREDDYISTTHRGHGDIIAKGATVESAMAELFGKTTGICRGRGGSLHIADLSKNILGANGIVGAGIPIAVGAALSTKYRRTDQVTVAFFGDGASMGGPIHESMNMAALWRLPLLFVRANNHYAESTPCCDHTGIPDIVRWAEGYGVKACRVDGNDVLAVREAALEAVARARQGEGPSFIECPTYRWYGHNIGDSGTWRPAEEIAAWKAKEPIARFRQALIESKAATDAELGAIDAEEEQRMRQAIEAADAAPKPDLQCAFEHTYADAVLGAQAMRGVRP
jgi:TPP-dependent pyruvate/acetoin dehydrogenase alpha subunit